MQEPKAVLELFKKYTPIIDTELKRALVSQSASDYKMYKMLQYFMGYLDESLAPVNTYGGKRFRSGLCLLIAGMYGNFEKVLPAAVSIELFHNFTLIHDDIVDKDELRRGRPTVWKLFGTDHAINAGDAQFAIATRALLPLVKSDSEMAARVWDMLTRAYLQVIEGQYLDFTLSALSLGDLRVNERDYLVMIERKTSVLVAAATGVTGLIAGLPKEEQEALWTYGLNLGLAYQLTDDMVSIWADPKFTGKKYGNDLHRRIKSLPVLRAYSELSSIDKASFAKLYAQNNDFTDTEIKNLVSLIDSTDAYQYTLAKVGVHKDLAGKALDQTTLNTAQKTSLKEIAQALLPEVAKMKNIL